MLSAKSTGHRDIRTGIVEVAWLRDSGHVVLAVDIAHDGLPGVLDIAGRAPQIGDIGDPLSTVGGVAAVLDRLDDVSAGLFVALVEAVLEVDPRCVLHRPIRPTAVVTTCTQQGSAIHPSLPTRALPYFFR
jgi:hypothetical protein